MFSANDRDANRLSTKLVQATIRIENIQKLLIQRYISDWSNEEKDALQDPLVQELCIQAFIQDMFSSRFRLCPLDYYDWSLEKRKSFLGRGKSYAIQLVLFSKK